MFPTRNQFKNWSLPSKASYVGAVVTVIAMLLALLFYLFPYQDNAYMAEQGNKESQYEDESMNINCNEKNARCQEISALIKRKEAEIEEKNYLDMQLSGPIQLKLDSQAEITHVPDINEIAREDELRQLRNQVSELRNDLFQCERTECVDY